MQIRWITFLLLGLIYVSSCKKEAENKHPVVTFIRPLGDTPLFSRIMDTVVFRVSDDKMVHSVSISFVNEDLISLTPPFTLNIHSKDTVIERIIKLGSLDVERGYILIRANDESQTKLKYQPVVFTDRQPPGEKVVFGFKESRQTQIAIFEPLTGQVTNMQSFDYEVEKLEGNIQSDFILSWPKSKRFVEVRAVREAATVWRAEAGFPQAEYVDYFLLNDKLLLADRNGNLKLHHFYTGNVQLNARVEASKLISAVSFDYQYLYAATKDLQSGKHWLMLFYRASGVLFKQIEMPIEAQDMLPASDSGGVFLLASNENGSTQIFSFDVKTDLIELKSTLSDFEFIPPAATQNGLVFLRNRKQIISWSSSNSERRIMALGTEIKGMATSAEIMDRVYYIDRYFVDFTNSGNLGGLAAGNDLHVIALIKE
ncbi:MAG: hypothetical protein M0Q90_08400 [Bacteroidales bacterium]|nr:hypothetical protein [Bacteroidales bacterium]